MLALHWITLHFAIEKVNKICLSISNATQLGHFQDILPHTAIEEPETVYGIAEINLAIANISTNHVFIVADVVN